MAANLSWLSFIVSSAFLRSVISLITPIRNLLPLLSTNRVFFVEIIRVSFPLNVKVSSLTFSTPVEITCLSIRRKLSFSSGGTFSAKVLPITSFFVTLKILQKASFTSNN